MGQTPVPREPHVERAEILARHERERAAEAESAASRQEKLADEVPPEHSQIHRRTAAAHRAALRLHQEAAALHALHADHERGTRPVAEAGPTWFADSRDRLADERDRIADERERLADTRDELADNRDRLADEREQLAEVRERRFAEAAGMARPDTAYTIGEIARSKAAVTRTAAAIERSEERIARAAARAETEQAEVDRQTAASRREEP